VFKHSEGQPTDEGRRKAHIMMGGLQ